MNDMPYLVAPPARSRRLVGRLSHCMMLSMADDRQLSSQSLPACLIRPGCQPGCAIPAASSLGRFQPSSCNIVRGASSLEVSSTGLPFFVVRSTPESLPPSVHVVLSGSKRRGIVRVTELPSRPTWCLSLPLPLITHAVDRRPKGSASTVGQNRSTA